MDQMTPSAARPAPAGAPLPARRDAGQLRVPERLASGDRLGHSSRGLRRGLRRGPRRGVHGLPHHRGPPAARHAGVSGHASRRRSALSWLPRQRPPRGGAQSRQRSPKIWGRRSWRAISGTTDPDRDRSGPQLCGQAATEHAIEEHQRVHEWARQLRSGSRPGSPWRADVRVARQLLGVRLGSDGTDRLVALVREAGRRRALRREDHGRRKRRHGRGAR